MDRMDDELIQRLGLTDDEKLDWMDLESGWCGPAAKQRYDAAKAVFIAIIKGEKDVPTQQ